MIGTSTPSPVLDEGLRLRAGSAVSWNAIAAGAVAAIALSIALIALGSGLGFAASSPFPRWGLTAGGLAVASTVWLIVTQWLCSAAGGYLTGRLRHRWLATHSHEVFFRDTAHGFVTWGVATIVVASILGTSAISLLGTGARVVDGATGGVGVKVSPGAALPASNGTVNTDSEDSAVYQIDKLFRTTPVGSSPEMRRNASRREVMHIAAVAATKGSWADSDRQYMASLVAADTGISRDEASHRVDSYIQALREAGDQTKVAADRARKVAAKAAQYTALALLVGAFIASVAAAIGGRLRDEHI